MKELVRRRNFLQVLDILNNIKKENSSSSKQCEMLFQFWFLEIGFHIHPEDATEADKIMMLDICEEYGEDWAGCCTKTYTIKFSEGIINQSFDCDSLISAGSRKEERKELLGLLVDMFTDAYFKVGTLDTAQLVAANNVPVFQYRLI